MEIAEKKMVCKEWIWGEGGQLLGVSRMIDAIHQAFKCSYQKFKKCAYQKKCYSRPFLYEDDIMMMKIIILHGNVNRI